ncbi:solute carrier family 13 member 2-like [Rhopilema esculentum]|uniref:solute carrier family 13 member 2-like n=1 Tax=Rhopilema esculentum TaxID=499914 RepID=UPI0031DA1DCF
MSDANERTRLITGSNINAELLQDVELEISRRPVESCDVSDARSNEEVGIDAALEPALGRKTWKSYLVLILTPILLCPLLITIPTMESRAGYGILIIVIYWVTETCPLAVTALLPIVLFPLLGVLSTSAVAATYFQDANVLFLGGLLVFVSFEEWNLHKRIALKILLLLGTRKQNLLFGFMLTTAGISMFLSNTATTALMVQIVKVILAELELGDRRQNSAAQGREDLENSSDSFLQQRETVFASTSEDPARQATISDVNSSREVLKEYSRQDDQKQFGKALLLAIAFSANIGGIGTLTGTGTNMIFAGQATKLFPKSGGISYAAWFGFAFPLMVVLLLVGWVYLLVLFLGTKSAVSCFRKNKDNSSDAIFEIIKHEYNLLGKTSFAEKAVLGHLVVLILLWLTKDPQVVPGWNSLFKKGYMTDGTVAILIAFSLFQFPSLMRENHARVYTTRLSLLSTRPLLDLQMVSEKLCWSVLVLLGGGFAIAAACQASGLSELISENLRSLKGVPDYAIVSIVCFAVTGFTEILSNTGTATIFLPVLASLAVSTHIHPWYLMIPATISCSFAFMFPVSTPPNAIVYSTGRLKMWDMVKAGIGMDIICLAVLLMFSNLYGSFYFKFKTFPEWAKTAQYISTVAPTNGSIYLTPSTFYNKSMQFS